MKSSSKIKVIIKRKNCKANTLFNDSADTKNKHLSSSGETLIEEKLNEDSVDDLGLLHELVSNFVGEQYDENEKQYNNTNEQLYLNSDNDKDDNSNQLFVDSKYIDEDNKLPGKAYKHYRKDQLLMC